MGGEGVGWVERGMGGEGDGWRGGGMGGEGMGGGGESISVTIWAHAWLT